ncbi:hypothetical protein [Noviherbaspirillum sedimenti]|uniref:hypothetical protein n=1 Tax=Noviherbaspirillum sedimenti TaxID=2320865 RepID=UPI0011C4508D|nr:hypothetical protein [Noviherbaspirillum sedimenti]
MHKILDYSLVKQTGSGSEAPDCAPRHQNSAYKYFQIEFSLYWCVNFDLHQNGAITAQGGRAKLVECRQNQRSSKQLPSGLIILLVAWNLLSFLVEFLIFLKPVGLLLSADGCSDLNSHFLINFRSHLGDSHGKNGRRGLEDGERQRSQIR